MCYLDAYFPPDTEIGCHVWVFGYDFFLVLKVVNTKMTLKYPSSRKAVHLSFVMVTFMLAIVVFYLFQVVVYLV